MFSFLACATDGMTGIYAGIADVYPKTDDLDNFFAHLTTSRYAIPAAYLGDISKSDAVTRAIEFQHGVIRAQNLNARYRIGANETADVSWGDPNDPERLRRLPVDPEYNVTATDPQGRRRVVQDEASTRVLQDLLAATLVFFLLGWRLLRDTDSLPRSATGIASVAAFVADGNLLDHLPEDAERLSDKQLERSAFGDGAMFRMGWGHSGSQRDAGNKDDNKGETFGIWVAERDDNLIEQWDPR